MTSAGRRAVLLLAALVAMPLIARAGSPSPRGEVFVIDYSADRDLTAADRGVAVDGLAVTASMSRPPAALKPIAFRVEIRNGEAAADATGVELAFNMKMDMGRRAVALQRDGAAWRGEVTLPPCVMGGKRWYARLRFTAGGRAHETVFLFDLS